MKSSAIFLRYDNTAAPTSSGDTTFSSPSTVMRMPALPSLSTMSKGHRSAAFSSLSDGQKARPIRRFEWYTVPARYLDEARSAAFPTRREFCDRYVTHDGVVFSPDSFAITCTLVPSHTATDDLRVPSFAGSDQT